MLTADDEAADHGRMTEATGDVGAAVGIRSLYCRKRLRDGPLTGEDVERSDDGLVVRSDDRKAVRDVGGVADAEGHLIAWTDHQNRADGELERAGYEIEDLVRSARSI